jgi:ribosomal protein L7/L12
MKIIIELEGNESKTLLELIASHIPVDTIGSAIASKVPDILDRLPKPSPEGENLRLRIVDHHHKIIESVRLVREHYGSGFKESKDFVDGNGPKHLVLQRDRAIALRDALIEVGVDAVLF